MNASADIKPRAESAAPALLVVEDEPLIRMDLADCLRLEGFTVIEASGPAEAREVLSSGAAVGCVLTDIHVPNCSDGLALLRWLAAERPALPVFVASGVSDSLELAKKACAGVVGAFEKPYHPNALAVEVRAVLASQA